MSYCKTGPSIGRGQSHTHAVQCTTSPAGLRPHTHALGGACCASCAAGAPCGSLGADAGIGGKLIGWAAVAGAIYFAFWYTKPKKRKNPIYRLKKGLRLRPPVADRALTKAYMKSMGLGKYPDLNKKELSRLYQTSPQERSAIAREWKRRGYKGKP